MTDTNFSWVLGSLGGSLARGADGLLDWQRDITCDEDVERMDDVEMQEIVSDADHPERP